MTQPMIFAQKENMVMIVKATATATMELVAIFSLESVLLSTVPLVTTVFFVKKR